MIFVLILAALASLWSGIFFDFGRGGLAFAFGAISVVLVGVAMLMYLQSGGRAEKKKACKCRPCKCDRG